MAKLDDKGNPIPFSVTAVTCDMERETGGERPVYAKAILVSPGGNKLRYHSRNDTRRIKIIPSYEIRTIHPILITEFNGKEVYL